MKRPDGVIVIAILYFLAAVPLLIGACAILGVPISGALQGTDRVGAFWATFGLGLGFLASFGLGVLSVVAGWGLLALKNWARWLAIVLAALHAILSVFTVVLFPVFLAVGIFVVWYLLQERVSLAFDSGAGAPEIIAASSEEVEVE